MGFFKFWWSDSNLFLMVGIQPPPQAVSWSLFDSLCLISGLPYNKTCIQWLRVRYHTCVCANNFCYGYKHKIMTHTKRMKYIPPNCQSFIRAYVSLIVTQGTIYHKVLGMRNCPLYNRIEVQSMRSRGDTTWTLYTFIYPIWKILRLLEVRKGTRGWTINWYRNIRSNPSSMRDNPWH